MRVSAPGRSYDHHDSVITELARYACEPGMLVIPNPFLIVGYLNLRSMMFKFHDCLRSMRARKTRGGADSQHAKGPCYREGDSGRLFIFQPYYSKRGFGLCRKSRRRGYDSGQPFLINHTILPAKGACRQNQARPAVSNPSPHTEHDSPQHSDD